MAKNYVKPGEHITFTAGATTASGQAVVIGSLLGVSLTALANGATGEAAIEGVWNLPCASAADITPGAKLIWDVSVGEFILTGAANGDVVGCATAVSAAGTGVTTVWAKLTPGTGTIQSGG